MRKERFVWGTNDIKIVNEESTSESDSPNVERESNLTSKRKDDLKTIKQSIKDIEKAEGL